MNSPFTPEQIAELDKPIDSKKVAHRQGGGGTQLSYIEGHEAIDAANRLFGYGSWGFEVVGVPTRDHYTDTNGEIKAMWYSAKIRLHVRGCEPIEEMGLVEVQLPKPGREYTFGQQVDVAMKGSITDALKRALRCYGDQFGNSLYDRALQDGQPGTEKSQPGQQRQQPPTTPTRPVVTPQAQRPVQTMPPAQIAPRTPQAQLVTPSPNPAPTSSELATEQQRTAIVNMAGRKGVDDIELNDRLTQLYGVELKALTRNDAAHFIKVFQGQA
jgi:DNA repair and recombination protein RAD52